ncbi:hypothetical protein [Bradyrhizobium sp.]|jgi:hypothetical protein|uniref:hypothetical protein n=1 Tax=Bradyrhizobium sp. TaxID=376 RepID=UPI003C49AAD5
MSASGAIRDGGESAAVSVITKWLHFAAAPTFAIMALSTVVHVSGQPNALCSAAGGFWPGGMASMYFLMALFHMTPWLKLISRR